MVNFKLQKSNNEIAITNSSAVASATSTATATLEKNCVFEQYSCSLTQKHENLSILLLNCSLDYQMFNQMEKNSDFSTLASFAIATA